MSLKLQGKEFYLLFRHMKIKKHDNQKKKIKFNVIFILEKKPSEKYENKEINKIC